MIVDVEGQRAHAATGGVAMAGEDPAMLLIHGAGMDGTVWQLQTRYLAHHGLRALAIDLPGHGRSEGEPLTTIADMAAWVGRFIGAAGLESAHVAGHSMGSFIALELAQQRPELVESLVLLGTATAMPVHPDLLSASADELDRAAALMAAWGHGRSAHVGLNPTPGLWMLGGARALVETSRPGALTADFTACADYDGAPVAAKSVDCPVRVVIGREDKMTPARAARALVAELPPDRVMVTELADVGHMMMIESPADVRRVLVEAAATSR